MHSQEVDSSNYYDLNGDKICDDKGKRIFIHIYGESVQDLETGELFLLRDDTSSEEDHEDQDGFKDFSYSLFICNIISCVISKIYGILYYVKKREL